MAALAMAMAMGAPTSARAAGREPDAMTPWFVAAERQDLAAWTTLMAGDLHARSAWGWTPLHAAAMHDFVAGTRALLAAGARLDARNRAGDTPLHCAGSLTQPLLLAAGADVQARNQRGRVPLHTVRQASDALLVVGVNLRDHLGMTALHVAAFDGNADKAAWLLDKGADPTLRSTGPLDLAGDPGWREPDVVHRFAPGQRALDLVQWQHDRVKWSTGRYGRTLDLLDAATPRAGWFSR